MVPPFLVSRGQTLGRTRPRDPFCSNWLTHSFAVQFGSLRWTTSPRPQPLMIVHWRQLQVSRTATKTFMLHSLWYAQADISSHNDTSLPESRKSPFVTAAQMPEMHDGGEVLGKPPITFGTGTAVPARWNMVGTWMTFKGGGPRGGRVRTCPDPTRFPWAWTRGGCKSEHTASD